MATRLLDQKPQYRLADGTLAAGGSLTFSITGTSTAKSVYGEEALSTNLGAVLTLDSAARTSTDVWLDGSASDYRVILKDSAGATVWTLDTVNDTVSATAYSVPDPAGGTADQAILTDGTVYYLADIIQVPTPSGHSGQYLTNDGAVISWAALATYSETSLPAGITQSGTDLQIGKYKIQNGSGVAPTASAAYTSVAVTFAEAFASAPMFIGIEPNTDNVTPAGALVSFSVTSRSTTGFTVKFYAGQEHGASDWYITAAVNFKYSAHGIVA